MVIFGWFGGLIKGNVKVKTFVVSYNKKITIVRIVSHPS